MKLKKSSKKYLLLEIVILIVIATSLSGCFFLYQLTDPMPVKDYYSGSDEEDISNSWSHITEEIKKSDDWKQIVTDSKFQLGEPYDEKDEWDDKYRYLTYGTFPVMDGSTVCVPMAMEFAWQHLNVNDELAKGMSYFNKTDAAYKSLIYGDIQYGYWKKYDGYYETFEEKAIDLILVTEPSAANLAEASLEHLTLDVTPICLDAFVFITHKDNPVDSLTVKQVQDIYSGKIKNWSEVGGADEEIVAYQRGKSSGSQTTMESQVMKGIEMKEPLSEEVQTGMGGLVTVVSDYENRKSSIGYTFKYYIDNQFINPDIKCISIDGVAPDFDKIQDKSYPFTTNYYAVIRNGDKDKTPGQFVQWMLSEEGQACIAQAGYCPLPQ